MGEAKHRKSATDRFLKDHPFCCLCGGPVPATTIEHAPPSVFFINKQLPAGTHRVPSCERCNHGSRQQDQVAALFALTMASAHRVDLPASYMDKLITGVSNNAPDAFHAMASQVPKAERFYLRANGLLRESWSTPVADSLLTDWIKPWAAKQAYALYYLHSGKIAPSTHRVMIGVYTNAALVDGCAPDTLLQALPNYQEVTQGSKTSGVQFGYRWQLEHENGYFVLSLQDACLVMTGVLSAATVASSDAELFKTSPETGIVRD